MLMVHWIFTAIMVLNFSGCWLIGITKTLRDLDYCKQILWQKPVVSILSGLSTISSLGYSDTGRSAV